MVFKRLFGRGKQTEQRAGFSIPDGERIYSIGDIHGRLDLFNALLDRIDADSAQRGPADVKLVLLGDLVDRGPDSRGVVQRALELTSASDKVRCLGGNHEDILLAVLEGDTRSVPLFDRVGGRATMISYGVTEETYDEAAPPELVDLARNVIPKEHVKFMQSLDDWIVAGDYLFVHAGIRPGVDLDSQTRQDMRWIRREFTGSPESHGYLVIHGHTITEGVDEQPNRIGIDTGAYESGRLTAIGLEGTERWFLDTSGTVFP